VFIIKDLLTTLTYLNDLEALLLKECYCYKTSIIN